MPNALDSGMPPPVQAQPNAQGNGLQQGGPPQQQQQQQAPDAPNSAQTVAALRHFDAVKGELAVLLKNPDLGKANLKGAVIDGVSKLVGERILSAPQAVAQLSQVPEDPLAQRKWVTQQMQQVTQAERGIIAHHAIGFAGQGPEPTPSADDHMQTMAGLHANYSGAK